MILYESAHVRLECVDGVAELRIDRPPMNALSREVQDAVGEAARIASADENVRVVLITGGDTVFAAGADIKEMATWTPVEVAAHIGPMHEAFAAVANIPVPVIAVIAGFALGGGCELALCADLRVAADNAILGQPEVNLGLIPGAGGTQRLARLIGPARAKDLIFTGRHVSAADALALGLVDRVVPAQQLRSQARTLALQLSGGSRTALMAAKRSIDQGLLGSL